ncbi:response regulator [bacterium]|nr:response regulator [bacterium]
MGKSDYNFPIGTLFLNKGYITQNQLDQLITFSKRNHIKFASAALELGFVSEKKALECLCEQTGFPGIHFSTSSFKVVPSLIPYQVALEKKILSIKQTDTNLLVAMADPFDKVLIDEISFITGKKVIAYICIEKSVTDAIHQCYNLLHQGNSATYNGDSVVQSSGEYFDILTPDVGQFEDEEEIELIVGEIIEDDELSKSDIISVPPLKGAKKILIVDDESDILTLVSKVVKKLQMEPITVLNGSDALPLIIQHKPDLVILDAMLPGMHGFEICKKIKYSELSYIPVIIISAIYKGWQFEKDILNLYKADKFMEKPFRINILMETIQQLLTSQTQAQQNISEQSIEALLREGVDFIKKGLYKDAKRIFDESIRISPFSVQAKYLLGYLYELTNESYLAITELESALEINRHYLPAAKQLATIYEKLGFRNKAIEKWQIVLELSDDKDLKEQIKKRLIKLVTTIPN